MIKIKKKKGFTLTEILVVVLIISVLSAVVYPLYTKSITKSRAVEAINLLEMVRNKQISNFARNGVYYNSFADMGQLVAGDEKSLLSDSPQIEIKDYTLSLNNSTNCMSAKYQKGSTSFTFSSSYETAGLGCTGSICSSFGGIVGDAASVCNCGNKACSGNFVLNPDTCGCDCALSCGGNFTLDTASCTCGCNISCSGGQVKDTANCSCYCPSPITSWNGSKCSCPSGTCLSGASCIQTESICKAGATEKEACGKNNTGVRMRSCKAGCPNTWGSWSACIGACPYDEASCAASKMTFDKANCTCKACPGIQQSKDGVTCTCPINKDYCAKQGKTFDAESCTCKSCPGELVSKDGVSCSCAFTAEGCASEGTIFDATDCACKPCKLNFKSTDGINCTCALSAEACAKQGKTFGMITCTCRDCPEGRKTTNGYTCECAATKESCAAQKKMLDAATCQCVDCGADECWSGTECINRNNKCRPDTVQKISCGKNGVQSRYWNNSTCPAGWSAWSLCVQSAYQKPGVF